MDTDPKMLPNQVIPDKTLDEDNVMETTDNCLISQQLVQDTNSQDILNHNLENEQLNIVRNNKNDIHRTEDLNDINQETAVVSTDTATSSNSCGAGAINIVTNDELDANAENTIVVGNGDSSDIVKEAEKDKSEQSSTTEVR